MPMQQNALLSFLSCNLKCVDYNSIVYINYVISAYKKKNKKN